MEKYIWSLDISTTNIGMALWDNKGKLIELKHLELKTDKNVDINNRIVYKAEIFRKYVEKYKEHILNELNGEITNIIIESPLGGSNNANTVALLFGFNGICTYILYKIYNIYPTKISVHDSRKLFCKELVHIETKKNRKTGMIEKIEVLSFPKEYIKDKKLYIWEKVSKLERDITWFYNKDGKLKDMNFDMSDAYCCGFSGMIILGIIKNE